jgi:MFS family permease
VTAPATGSVRGGPATRRLVAAVYGPALLYFVGEGAVLPVVALSARERGASVGVAGLVVALLGAGQLAGDLPAGALVARLGERRSMLLSALVAGLALVVCVTSGALRTGSVAVLAAGVTVLGGAGAVWGLARQSYLAVAVPIERRARAMSTLGGAGRVGLLVGPLIGAAVIGEWGVDAAYGVHAVSALAASGLVLASPDLGHDRHPAAGRRGGPALREVVRASLPVLRTLGTAVLLVGAARASRQAVLPLWGEHVGLDARSISLVFAVSGAIELLLVYPSGTVMDRRGRAAVAVPCMTVLGLAHLVLPLAGTATGVLAVAVLMGLGNGLGSGLVMTLGADASPDVGRHQFLGAWRLMVDVGGAGGPVVVSAVTATVALGPAVAVMGLVTLLGAAALARWVPAVDPVVRARARAERAG